MQLENPAQFSDLLSGGVDLLSLDDQGQALFGGVWSGMSNAATGVLAGTPVNVSLSLFPRLLRNGADVSTGQTAYTALIASKAVRPTTLPKTISPPRPFVAHDDGELDFGQGKILTIVALANQASAKFSFGYRLDSRSASETVFIKGRYTRERIIEALKTIGLGGPTLVVRQSMSKAGLDALKRKVLLACLAGLGGKDDPKIAYLARILSDPSALDATALEQFGFKSDTRTTANSISLGMAITMSSDINDVTMRDGSHRITPITYTMVVNGS